MSPVMTREFEDPEEFLEWLEDFELLPENDKKPLSGSDDT